MLCLGALQMIVQNGYICYVMVYLMLPLMLSNGLSYVTAHVK